MPAASLWSIRMQAIDYRVRRLSVYCRVQLHRAANKRTQRLKRGNGLSHGTRDWTIIIVLVVVAVVHLVECYHWVIVVVVVGRIPWIVVAATHVSGQCKLHTSAEDEKRWKL